LPRPWKPCQVVDTEEIFYFNFETGESVWDHPVDEYYRQVFEEEREKAERPKRIVTLDATPQADGTLNVSCTNLGGSEIGMVNMRPIRTLEKLARQLGEQLELSKREIQQFRFVLTDGRLLTESDLSLPLAKIFDVPSCQDDQQKSQELPAPNGTEVLKKKKKKYKPSIDDVLRAGSRSHDKVRQELPPLKLGANRTRISKLQKSGALELSRLFDDGLLLDSAKLSAIAEMGNSNVTPILVN
jgi:hypothetical protein